MSVSAPPTAISDLRERIARLEGGNARERTVLPFGVAAIDRVLPGVLASQHWNTVYIERAVTHLRKIHREIPDHLLKHVSPLSWEHINLTGIYTWDAEYQMPEGFRSLRLPAGLRRAA